MNPVPVLSVRSLTVSFGNRAVNPRPFLRCYTRRELGNNRPQWSRENGSWALLNQLPYEGVIEWAPETKLGYVPQAVAADRELPLLVSDLLGAKARLLRIPPDGVRQTANIVGLTPDLLATRIGVLSVDSSRKP